MKKVIYCIDSYNDGAYKTIEDSSIIQSFCKLEDLPEWISVKDRLPEHEGFVLTVRKGIVTMSYYDLILSKAFKDSTRGFEDFDEISYWQPLPSPPKEDEG
jgi:hypothetical protein